jgi:hypothetical protein
VGRRLERYGDLGSKTRDEPAELDTQERRNRRGQFLEKPSNLMA